MISTTAHTASLLQFLTRRAQALALKRAEALAKNASRSPINWHSARSLWPDFTQD